MWDIPRFHINQCPSCSAFDTQRHPNERPHRRDEPIAEPDDARVEVSHDTDGEEEFLDAQDYNAFELILPNRDTNFEEMAKKYFARVDEIHRDFL